MGVKFIIQTFKPKCPLIIFKTLCKTTLFCLYNLKDLSQEIIKKPYIYFKGIKV